MTSSSAAPVGTLARVAAGALFFDDAGRVMLVHPVYKDYWDIPGGYVEAGETPRQACEREVAEELDLQMTVGQLLAVDWAPHPDEGDKMLFVFDGGRLTPEQLAVVKLQPAELDAYAFRATSEFDQVLIPRLARRLTAAVGARSAGRVAYLENGSEVGGRGHGFGHELPSTGAAGVHQSPNR